MIYVPKDTAHKRSSRSKYRNTKCKAQGRKFDSIGERDRFFFLQEAQSQGRIKNLRCQVKFSIVLFDQTGGDGPDTLIENHICDYIADFVYEVVTKPLSRNVNVFAEPITIVEDFKGGYRLPPDWPIKQKLMKAVYGIDVRIVKSPTMPTG